jgi:hypothetical protein
MKARSVLVVALFAIVCGESGTESAAASQPSAVATQKADAVKTSTDPSVNPHAAAMADFKARVEKYAALHRGLAKGAARQKERASPDEITAQKSRLAAKIQAARADAKHGDIFAPELRQTFRQLLAPELKGEDGRDARAVLRDDAPASGTVPFKVNAKYPENQPKPTMPAKLLLNLPRLPEPLEYRVVGQHLLLLDTAADVIVDYILNAITM